MPTVSKPTRTSSRLLTPQRWEVAAAAQLRNELSRLSAERDALAAKVTDLERRLDDLADALECEERFRSNGWEQTRELLDTARRAGISLRVRPIGMTRDGQIGLTAGQVAS